MRSALLLQNPHPSLLQNALVLRNAADSNTLRDKESEHIKLIPYSWEHLFLLDPSLTRPTAPYCAQRAPFPEYQNTEHDPMNPMKVTTGFLDYSLRMFHF